MIIQERAILVEIRLVQTWWRCEERENFSVFSFKSERIVVRLSDALELSKLKNIRERVSGAEGRENMVKWRHSAWEMARGQTYLRQISIKLSFTRDTFLGGDSSCGHSRLGLTFKSFRTPMNKFLSYGPLRREGRCIFIVWEFAMAVNYQACSVWGGILVVLLFILFVGVDIIGVVLL